MAAMYYCLVAVLVLGALVNGQDDVLVSEPQLQLRNENEVRIDTEVFQRLLDSMTNQSVWCIACEGVVDFLRSVVENKIILQEVVTILLPLCDWAPCKMQQVCIGFMDGIPGLVKNYTDTYFNTQTACAWLCEASLMTNDETISVPLMINDLVKMMGVKKPIKP